MSRSSTFRTAQGFLVAGLCFAAVFLWLSAVASATPWNGGTVQTSAPLALPGNPELTIKDAREAMLRRARGGFATTARPLQFPPDLDDPQALATTVPTVLPTDRHVSVVAATSRQIRRRPSTEGFQSRAPPPGA